MDINNVEEPNVQVTESQLPGLAATLLRYLAAPLGGFLIGRGLITAEQAPQVAGALIAVATAAWGLYQTYINKKKIVAVAKSPLVPDSVASLK